MVPCNMCYVPYRSSLYFPPLLARCGGKIKYTLMKQAQNRKLTSLYQSCHPNPHVIADTLCHRHFVMNISHGEICKTGKIFHFQAYIYVWC